MESGMSLFSSSMKSITQPLLSGIASNTLFNYPSRPSHTPTNALDRPNSNRALFRFVSRTNCIVVFINQLREKIGVMYGNPETTPGGRALKYFSSVRIDVRRIETLKVGGEMIGNRTRAKIVKNKVAPPFKEAEFDIIYGEGISKIGEIVDLGVKLDLIDKAGAWYTYGDVRVQGRDSMKEYLREHPDVSDKIEAEIRANAHKLMSPQARKAAIASGRAVEVAADDFQG